MHFIKKKFFLSFSNTHINRYEKISLFRNILIHSPKRMHQVLAAGIIIFRDTNPNFREYLLLQKDHCKSENWAPPKGNNTFIIINSA